MCIDISEILSVKDKTLSVNEDIKMEVFHIPAGDYPFHGVNHYEFLLTNIGKKRFLIEGSIDAHLDIPCDRCLEIVNTPMHIEVSKEVDLNEGADKEEQDELSLYVDDESVFHFEPFVCNEILVNLPMKVLCKIDCKGICNRCGTNLNYESCDCDTKELDPRMAKVLDVFKQFKEV